MARAATRARHGSYIFQRGSIWYRRTGSDRVAKSLGTRDKAAAEILALKHIEAHKLALQAARPRFETVPQFTPGGFHMIDGVQVFADASWIHYPDGRKEPNEAQQLVGGPLTHHSLYEAHKAHIEGERPQVAVKTSDDALFAAYLEHGGAKRAGIHGSDRKEAEHVWHTFKTLVGAKALKSCSRDDGRRLATHFFDLGNSSGTVRKKVNWLNAAVNLAIREGLFTTVNPFAGVVAMKDDKEVRLPLDATDMQAILGGLGSLDAKDQLLVRLLATTGMRLGEAIDIDHEEPAEHGVRFVIVGTKTEASKRRVPLPADVLAHLPPAIKGRLFDGDAEYASKRLNRFLRGVGITDPRKVVHSFRHRAQDRLRAAECPSDVREAILGHEKKSVAQGYGTGFSVPQLRKWIDCISF
jgi:integrase